MDGTNNARKALNWKRRGQFFFSDPLDIAKHSVFPSFVRGNTSGRAVFQKEFDLDAGDRVVHIKKV